MRELRYFEIFIILSHAMNCRNGGKDGEPSVEDLLHIRVLSLAAPESLGLKAAGRNASVVG